MTMPDPDSPRKPPRRFWLFAPYVVLLVAAAVWSGVWLAARASLIGRLDAAAERLRGEGYVATWKSRAVGGYPFRLDVVIQEARLVEPSGWGLSAPRLEAQAYAYAPDHWLAVADQGVIIERPKGGPVAVAGRVLRASVVGVAQATPRVSVEGVDLTFTPQPGGRPFAITHAQQLGLHMRPSGEDRVEGYLLLAGANAAPGGWLSGIAGDRPLALVADGFVSQPAAFSGRDWPQMARHWAAAGGAVEIAQAGMAAGTVRLGVGRGRLSLDSDGSLAGGLALDIGRAPGVVDSLSRGRVDPLAAKAAAAVIDARRATGRRTLVDLTFQAGATTLGPVAIGPAPRVY